MNKQPVTYDAQLTGQQDKHKLSKLGQTDLVSVCDQS